MPPLRRQRHARWPTPPDRGSPRRRRERPPWQHGGRLPSGRRDAAGAPSRSGPLRTAPTRLPASTSITLCGRLRVAVGGEPREERLHGRQGRLALAYLLLHRERPVRRDELVEAVWARDGAAPSDSALSPVLSRLRRALAPATIEGRNALELTLPEP